VEDSKNLETEKLSEFEVLALEFLSRHGGCILTSKIPDRNDKGFLGDAEAGMPVYKKLEKRGFVVLTVEDPDEDGFTFTPMAELTPTGAGALQQHRQR
jgi:hypothetical protein